MSVLDDFLRELNRREDGRLRAAGWTEEGGNCRSPDGERLLAKQQALEEVDRRPETPGTRWRMRRGNR